MSNGWSMLTAGALPIYDGSKLLSDDAVLERAARQVRRRGEPMPKALPPKPRDDAHGLPVVTQADVKAALGGLKDRPFLFGMAAFLGDIAALVRLESLLHSDILNHASAGEWIEDDRDTVEISRISELMLFEVISARSRNDQLPGDDVAQRGSVRVMCPQCRGKGFVTPARDETLREHVEAERDDAAEEYWNAYYEARPYREGEEQVKGFRKARGARYRRAMKALAALPAVWRTRIRCCDLCRGVGTFLLTEVYRAQAIGVNERAWYRKWKGRYAELIEIPMGWEHRALSHVRWRLAGIRDRS